MKQFDLPVVSSEIELNEAFAELFESQHSALVVRRADGRYRLVSFDHLTEALAHGAKTLDKVNGQALMMLGPVAIPAANAAAVKAGVAVVLLTVTGQQAFLHSVSESKADPLIDPSNTVRCDRPNKPAATKNKDWYHYYPPDNEPGPRPFTCVGPGCVGGTVR